MHRHHGKWIWGLSQLSQSLKALGSSLCQRSYTKQQWVNLPLSAPQRKYLLLASTNPVLYITYFSKSPQQYHRVYMNIIIDGVPINSVYMFHLWWDSMSHSHGIRTEPSRGWATFRIHVFLFLSCIPNKWNHLLPSPPLPTSLFMIFHQNIPSPFQSLLKFWLTLPRPAPMVAWLSGATLLPISRKDERLSSSPSRFVDMACVPVVPSLLLYL